VIARGGVNHRASYGPVAENQEGVNQNWLISVIGGSTVAFA
jgi:hypothetical protein